MKSAIFIRQCYNGKLTSDANKNISSIAYNGISNNPTDPPFEIANSQKLYKLNSGSKRLMKLSVP